MKGALSNFAKRNVEFLTSLVLMPDGAYAMSMKVVSSSSWSLTNVSLTDNLFLRCGSLSLRIPQRNVAVKNPTLLLPYIGLRSILFFIG